MKYFIRNKHWEINKDYDKEILLYLLIDRPDDIFFGSLFWLNGKDEYNRDYDLPAVVGKNGYLSWYKNYESYRKNNKSAIIYKDNL